MEKQKLNILCDTITLDVFIDCLINGNLRRLNAAATEEELKKLWDDVSEEYAKKTRTPAINTFSTCIKIFRCLKTGSSSASYS